MADEPEVRENYTLARCCRPKPPDNITGYYSLDPNDKLLKVHRSDCANLGKADQSRLVALDWADILIPADNQPDDTLPPLDHTDIAILRHHERYGIDYSHKVARMLGLSREAAFSSHNHLRELGLVERVEPRIVEYRRGLVKNTWIKHRNHTYYALTEKGRRCLQRLGA